MDYFKEWINNLLYGLDPKRMRMERHHIVRYSLGRVRDFKSGCVASIAGFWRHIGLAIIQPFFKSDSWARSYGALGCICGLILSPFYLVWQIIRSLIVFADRFVTGFYNGCCGKSYLYVLDWRRDDKINEKGYIRAQLDENIAHGFTEQRKKQVFRATAVVTNAKILFDKSNPFFPHRRVDFKVAKASNILSVISEEMGKLSITNEESIAILDKLKRLGDRPLCFSQLILIIQRSNFNANSSNPSQRIGGSQRDYNAAYRIDPGYELYATLFGTLQGGDVPV
jgi:hypothetical protein